MLGNYVKQDVNKALYYLNISAKYDSDSQHILGVIYYQGKFVQRDVNKALYCFNLSAKHNNLHSLFCIGYIYYEGIYVFRNQKVQNHTITLVIYIMKGNMFHRTLTKQFIISHFQANKTIQMPSIY